MKINYLILFFFIENWKCPVIQWPQPWSTWVLFCVLTLFPVLFWKNSPGVWLPLFVVINYTRISLFLTHVSLLYHRFMIKWTLVWYSCLHCLPPLGPPHQPWHEEEEASVVNGWMDGFMSQKVWSLLIKGFYWLNNRTSYLFVQVSAVISPWYNTVYSNTTLTWVLLSPKSQLS